MNRFIKFGIVGTIGFLVDSSILLILVKILSYDIYLSRIISFIVAVFVTWYINRSFTFKTSNKKKKKEYFLYLIIQSIGALINYCIFIFLVINFEFFKEYLIFSVAIASILVMFFNYFSLKLLVYK